VLEKAFQDAGEIIPRTDKGNPSFNDEALESFKSPVAEIVRGYRDAHKKANTYYRNFLYYADAEGVIHANIKPGGARTGRMSVTDPALQTLPADEEDNPFPVRRAFIPRPGFFFFMPDYDQMEYRMMLDYARQMDVIEQVKGGMDIHDATAKAISDMLGIAMTRSQAKTLNFGLLYGMGIDALAAALKTTVEKARQLRNAYFQALPFVKGFIRRVTHRAETTGYIFNWTGRRSYFDKKEFCYKAPNALIQGGCCDVLKTAVNLIDDYLAGRKSKILMLVHDEILFEIHESESQICRDLVGIMANVYPHRYLPLSCSSEHSFQSWGNKLKGYPA
jgi:DNA polymerase-1